MMNDDKGAARSLLLWQSYERFQKSGGRGVEVRGREVRRRNCSPQDRLLMNGDATLRPPQARLGLGSMPTPRIWLGWFPGL